MPFEGILKGKKELRGREAEKEKRKEIIFLKLEAKIETLRKSEVFTLAAVL